MPSYIDKVYKDWPQDPIQSTHISTKSSVVWTCDRLFHGYYSMMQSDRTTFFLQNVVFTKIDIFWPYNSYTNTITNTKYLTNNWFCRTQIRCIYGFSKFKLSIGAWVVSSCDKCSDLIVSYSMSKEIFFLNVLYLWLLNLCKWYIQG